MPTLYIIAGCNGAGKTTASNTILPEILDCREFVNADNIAAGLSPFDVEKYAIEAGRLMSKRIDQLMFEKVDFAIETTLASKTYLAKIRNAKKSGYRIVLLFFWLNHVKLAFERVSMRVKSGGHSIPKNVIQRRYKRGIVNFFVIYMNEVDSWIVIDNSTNESVLVAEGEQRKIEIKSEILWRQLADKFRKSTR